MAPAAPIWEKRLVLVTGKGGVGKTSLTAAMARAAHAARRRVLVGEVAPDLHSPSTLLGYFGQPRPKGEEPVELARGLYGVRLSPAIGHRLFLRNALKVRILVDAAMRSAALTRFLMAAPTFPEIGTLYQLVWLLRLQTYDHFILDLPATGHAVGLAALPRTVVRIVPTGLIGDTINEGLRLLNDPAHTGAVVATLPEAMPVTETLELIAALREQKIAVRAAILNQLPPDPFSALERGSLRAFVDRERPPLLGVRELRRLERALEARDAFRAQIPDSIPRVELPIFEGASGLDLINRLSEALQARSAA